MKRKLNAEEMEHEIGIAIIALGNINHRNLSEVAQQQLRIAKDALERTRE
ncbi:MAG: hypothetical protein UT24_C0003G0009 [Candidatus Woesebacteria bacterium GW2011_GWB1_39_12]|uniref:Uncharacterized protein n=1 Tax=Candidatus Woesebacteria bacterium GW2011_GWB1_39_12 TaxID=1618574 RepID=A0A0G0QIV3_9BACT|nr:MAG: hypothetical protein UT24_C0003G0009 [Candidatus Woesebacteria bacterium GW2011_GWB1_39_12]